MSSVPARNAALGACARDGAWAPALAIFALGGDLVTTNAAISACVAGGAFSHAEALLENVEGDAVTWSLAMRIPALLHSSSPLAERARTAFRALAVTEDRAA